MKKETSLQLLSIVVIIGCFLTLSVPFIHAPASQDDFWNFESAKRLSETRIPLFYRGVIPHLEHPPLYLYLLAFFLENFGQTLAVGRSLGILTACLALILLFYLCRIFYHEERHPLFLSVFPCLILSTSPMLIQGSQIIDIDVTLLLFTFTLLISGWFLFGRTSSVARDLGVGLLFALTLWSKVVTPLFLPLGILVTTLFSKRMKALWSVLRPFGMGLLFFTVSWFAYCLKQEVLNSFWDLIGYHLGAAHVIFIQKASATFSFSKSLWALMRMGGWFYWPLLLLLGMGWVGLQRGKREDPFVLRSLLNSVLLASLGYLFTKGLSFSFPKYHLPFLPFFCLVATWPLRSVHLQHRTIIFFLISLVALMLFQMFIIGDFLYPLLFSSRQALVEGKIREIAIQLCQKGLLSLFAFLVAWGGMHLVQRKQGLRQTFLLTLGAMVIASNLSQDILQMRAPYLTGNLYGDSSRKEVITLLKKALQPGDVLIAHDLIHFELGSFSSPFVSAHLWEDPEAILELLEKTKARALAYSLTIHTVSQYRKTFLNPEFQARLRDNFERVDLGTYRVWIRRDAPDKKRPFHDDKK